MCLLVSDPVLGRVHKKVQVSPLRELTFWPVETVFGVSRPSGNFEVCLECFMAVNISVAYFILPLDISS